MQCNDSMYSPQRILVPLVFCDAARWGTHKLDHMSLRSCPWSRYRQSKGGIVCGVRLIDRIWMYGWMYQQSGDSDWHWTFMWLVPRNIQIVQCSPLSSSKLRYFFRSMPLCRSSGACFKILRFHTSKIGGIDYGGVALTVSSDVWRFDFGIFRAMWHDETSLPQGSLAEM